MIPEFDAAYAEDDFGRVGGPGETRPDGALGAFFARYGGKSFAQGLYRVAHSGDDWAGRLAGIFPDFAGRATCFGFDWLGRAFGLDRDRRLGDEPLVLMFEPGTGDALEIPATLTSFHDSELIDDPQASVALDFHHEWIAQGGAPPRYDQCIGYRRPLFLGGQDAVANLEVIELDVYWSTTADLLRSLRTRSTPPPPAEKPRGFLARLLKR